ncbi:putative lipid II flippase FtsW [Thiohalocapsa halophila]|uniref:Probable peptidoglycan glycosyltransferase FtsW n=1 Tax=Thiohalocapsa halophila TaxID=69359 RepID=A0ABS1CKW0_9GAMM|nr:putative lipid II flippase FtsW [Thiohalocapsa halophila]MBK1632555.1 putative lipid II flippase FtsW [Thiohalocapsa halophila]
MSQVLAPEASAGLRRRSERSPAILDAGLLVAVLCLLGLGFVMVTSASMPMADRNYDDPFFFVLRHGVALALALTCGAVCFAVPSKVWENAGPLLMLLAIGLLVLLLVPGVGRTVNGATRWIPLGLINLQPSELVKFTAVIYLSGYLVRRELDVRTSLMGFLRPMLLVGIAGMLIMAQPDFGTTAVILATAMALLFLGGVSVLSFVLLGLLLTAGLAALIIIEPYRLQRVTSFVKPFDDPFDTGYQLSQALIAFGRGEWLGVGLGNGIQKQFYLPEAHTDFLLAVMGEELGLVGVLVVVAVFAYITWRAFVIGARARRQGDLFGCYAAHGFGLLIGLQAFINVGVNTGLLPTKGLPLPFMSYGSNALIVAAMAVGVLLRIDFELRRRTVDPIPEGGLHRERPAPSDRPLRERQKRERGATWRRG